MSYWLAIESSSRRGTIALAKGGEIVAAYELRDGRQHAAELVPLARTLCREHGIRPTELAGVMVSSGPGAFTGTRIGVTFAKTLATATGCQLVAVDSSHVTACNVLELGKTGKVMVVLDARRGKVWADLVDISADSKLLQPVARLGLCTPKQAVEAAFAAIESPEPVIAIGEGLSYHDIATNVPVDSSSRFSQVDAGHAFPNVRWLVKLGTIKARRNDYADPAALSPLYVRLPEAVENRIQSASLE